MSLENAVMSAKNVHGFMTQSDMEEMTYPEDSLSSFFVELGDERYFKHHLKQLADEMNEKYGYCFDEAKLAAALYHIAELDGFFDREVLHSGETDGPGVAIEIQYRTDKMYPIRVRIAPDSWYILAPAHYGNDAEVEGRDDD